MEIDVIKFADASGKSRAQTWREFEAQVRPPRLGAE
jgi:hypothetical protein